MCTAMKMRHSFDTLSAQSACGSYRLPIMYKDFSMKEFVERLFIVI